MSKLRRVASDVAVILAIIVIVAGLIAAGHFLPWHFGPLDPVEAAK